MECKTLSPKRRAAGYTMVEFIVASALALLISGALVSFSIFSGRSLMTMSNYLEMDAQARSALDSVTLKLRQAKSVTAFATNSITLNDYDSKPLVLSYDKTQKTLTSTKNGSNPTVLLTGCESLTFNMFSRDPNDATFDLDTTTDVTQCKAIYIAWNSTRYRSNGTTNAANMTTATVILRTR